MNTKTSSTMVRTGVGPLAVRRIGAGEPAVLWHSMFVDSETFADLARELGRDRELLLVDGPGHGGSPGPRRLYSLQDCAAAAAVVLDACNIAGPVDWVGNAWGGHVGFLFADSFHARCKTLTTIGTPVYPLPAAMRLKTQLLVQLYRALGPRPLRNIVVESIVGHNAEATEPTAASAVSASFQRGDKRGKYWAMRSLMLRRPDLRPLLPRIQVPTLMLGGQEDALFDVKEAERAAQSMPAGQFMTVPGGGHVAPLFVAPAQIAGMIRSFWSAHRTG